MKNILLKVSWTFGVAVDMSYYMLSGYLVICVCAYISSKIKTLHVMALAVYGTDNTANMIKSFKLFSMFCVLSGTHKCFHAQPTVKQR